MMKYRGVAYYPEFWPQERWDEDIRLMKDAKINFVRIGEFAWESMEPAEGVFTLDWLHTIIGKFQKAKIDVMLCTPTATPPIWLTKAYPDTLAVRRDRFRVNHGMRRHYCPNNATFRRHSARITEKLAREFSQYDNVIAWQLDNEIGPECTPCYCNDCSAAFRNWCRERYGTLEGLNKAWQTKFWSMGFSEWNQVGLDIMPGGNVNGRDGYPSIELDIWRFFADTWVNFAAHQTDIIRQHHPRSMVGTNLMGPVYIHINNYKMAEMFDYIADDLYFDIGDMAASAQAMDVFRCIAPGKRFWITETGSGALNHYKGPYPKQIRAWAFSALAHGSEAHMFFRWRTCLAGHEQDMQGVIEASGRPGRRYQAVKDLFTELASLDKPFANLPVPAAQVAMINNYDVHWAYASTRIGHSVQENAHFSQMHKQFFDRNVAIDIIPADRDLSPYKLVILPVQCMVSDDLAKRLRAFVKAGGVVLATPQLACRDANYNYIPRLSPDGLLDVMGLQVEGHTYMENAVDADAAIWVPVQNVKTETVAVEFAGGPTGIGERYMEDITLTTAAPLATYRNNMYAGVPAAAVNKFGKGTAFYMATFLDDALLGHLVEQALDRAGVPHDIHTDPWVEVITAGDFTFAINHSKTTTQIDMPAGQTIVGEVRDDATTLEPFDVCVVKRT